MSHVRTFALWLLAAVFAVGAFAPSDAEARKRGYGGKHYSTGAVVKADTRDIGGWLTYTPKTHQGAYSVPDLTQTGSRIYYINPSTGVDSLDKAVASYYYWNGTNIVDTAGNTVNPANGQVYGTDPFHPNEAAILPYQRWAFSANGRNGNGRDATGDILGLTRSDIGEEGFNANQGRVGHSDWWLFKAGQTVDLQADLAAYGTTNQAGLTMPCATDANFPQIVGAYGDLSGGRAKFTPQTNLTTRQFIRRGWSGTGHSPGYCVYRDIEFNGHTRVLNGTPGIQILNQPSTSNFVFENVWVNGTWGFQYTTSHGRVQILRSLITDSWSSSGTRTLGIYASNYTDALLEIKETIWLRNGFAVDPTVTWPGTFNSQERNLYLSGMCHFPNCVFEDSVSMIGGSGDQFRPGFRVRRNFFYQGYVDNQSQSGFTEWGGTGYGFNTQRGRSAELADNVLQSYFSTGAHPTWGYGLGAGSRYGSAHRNILTAAALGAATQERIFGIGNVNHYQGQAAVAQMVEHDVAKNIFYGTPTTTGLQISDGVTAGYNATVTVTAATPAVMTMTGGVNLIAQNESSSPEPFRFLSTGTLPGGITADTTYYACSASANTTTANYQLSLTANCAVRVNTTTTGTGTVSIIDASSATLITPGITRMVFRDNILVGADEGTCSVAGYGGSCPDDTTYSNNTLYASQAAATSGQGWPAPNRTLATYLTSLGYSFGDDGFLTYYGIVTAPTFTRGNWRRDMTAKYLVNYIRWGFGWPAIP